jgi:peptidoglycan hydrolase CwlO-like protein
MKKGTLILLLLLLLISILGNVYYFSKAKKCNTAFENQKEIIGDLNEQKDSLLQVLSGLQEELQIVWSENNLGVERIGELEIVQVSQQKRINSLLRKLAAAKNIEDVESLQLQITQLSQEKEILAKSELSNGEKIIALKKLNEDLDDTNNSLVQGNTEKNKTLAKAQKPNFNELLISPIRIRKGREELALKAKHVSFLRIKLKMFKNPITNKSILMPLKVRIISPDGAVLTKDTKKITDKNEISTILETVNFRGQEKLMKWDYLHNSDLEKGVYEYELIADGELIQVGSFNLE